MKKPHEPPRQHRKGARQRGALIEQIVCSWVRRWGYTSDLVLEYLYPSRKRLGYDLARKGRLKRWPADPGYRLLDGPAVYGRTDYSDSVAEEQLYMNCSDILGIEHSATPAWSTMQHLLDCQRIALALGMLPDSIGWLTEPEARASAPQGVDLVPDMLAHIYDPDPEKEGVHWIEYDRTPKSDVVLDHFTQRLARRVEAAHDKKLDERERPEPIARITIIVSTEYQFDRYDRYFKREYADYLYRDRTTRKLKKPKDKARQPIAEVLKGLVDIRTLTQITEEPELEPEERVKLLGLG